MDNDAIPDSNWIPEGFVEITGPSGEHYLVPQFYAPALNNTLDGLDEKRKMEIEKAAGTVRDFYSSYFGVIGEEMIMAPIAPGSSDRERLSAHAEVIALQNRLGISYKDASHRLYMAEMEKLKTDEKTYRAFATLKATAKDALDKAYDAAKRVEGMSDEMDTT